MGRVQVRQIPISETRPLRRAVLRPHLAAADLAAHEPPGAFAVGAYEGAELIAVGFVAPDGKEPQSWRVRGMATVPSRRGTGAGTEILRALIRYATAQGARRIWCNARVRAHGLYERAGFTVVSEEFELPQIGPHYVMEKLLVR